VIDDTGHPMIAVSQLAAADGADRSSKALLYHQLRSGDTIVFQGKGRIRLFQNAGGKECDFPNDKRVLFSSIIGPRREPTSLKLPRN
jgi:hypothetical protein